MKSIPLNGQKFGRLTAIGRLGSDKWGQAIWDCKCDCGSMTSVTGGNLRSGNTTSCGCVQKEETAKASTTHGERKGRKYTTEYTCWISVKDRCQNPKDAKFKDYGGRGIKVCDRWNDSYENFLADMGRKPSPKHSIDRLDNDGNYEPGNCRWATAAQQNANKRAPNGYPAPKS